MEVEELIETVKSQQIETNRYILEEQYLISKLQYQGNGAITENNYADEPTHNAYDAGACNQKFVINDIKIMFGNDGNGISWKDTISTIILYKKSCHKNDSTSFYGVGSTKVTVFSDGIPELYGTIYKGKYYIRKFEWFNFPDGDLTRENVKNITGANFIEYEVSKEEYEKYIPSDFGFLPTFFVSIHRYTDSLKDYNPIAMINSLNSQMMNTNRELKTTISVRGKHTKSSSKIYYPTLVEKNGKKLIPRHYSDLKKYNKNPIEIGGGKFDLYIYKTIRKSDGGVDYQILMDENNGGTNLLNLGGRGLNPFMIWINHMKVQLVKTEYTGAQISKKYGELLGGTVAVWVLIDGKFEFPTIKTEKVFEKYAEVAKAHYVDAVRGDSSIQYNSRKVENSKVDEIVKLLTTTEDKYISTRNDLVNSILHLTNDTYTSSNIKDENAIQYRVRPPKDNLREYDFMIKNNKTNKLDFQIEFQQNQFDPRHLDGFLSRVTRGTSKYNVWVADSRGPLNEYIDWLSETLKNVTAEPGTILWAVLFKDLINGNESKFIKIKEY